MERRVFPRLPVRLPLRRSCAVAVVVTLLTALPAVAHPFIRGGEVPVRSLATLTLAMAHGCGGDTGGAENPTTEVALEVPGWMRVIETPPKEGWTIEHETGEDGATQVVSWSTEDPVEPAPEFELEEVVTGEPGEERFLGVFQGCGDAEYRWVGTPEEPAEDPAVRLTLAPADPDRPASEPEVDAGQADGPDGETATDGAAEGAPPADTAAPGGEVEPEPTDQAEEVPDAPEEAPAETGEALGADEEPAGAGEAVGVEEEPAESGEAVDEELAGTDDAAVTDDDGGVSGWLLVAVAVLVVVGGGAAAFRARQSRTGRAG